MIPKDAPKQDWNMYYHDTYMTHKQLGPCRISIMNGDSPQKKDLMAQQIVHGTYIKLDKAVKVRAADLQILWPRPGAYNFVGLDGAGFIGRQPQRHMKRSAYRDHYYVQWSPVGIPDDTMMAQISTNVVYRSLDQFFAGLDIVKRPIKSAALSNKVILYRPNVSAAISIVYMAEEIGFLSKENKLVVHQPNDSRLPRIMRHLGTLGIS